MRNTRRNRRRVISNPEINLTPLIDTALTLLIIFMVTTPMIQNSIKIDLPKGEAQEGGKEQQELVVTIDKKDTIYCNNKIVTLEMLGPEIQQKLAQMPNKEKTRVWIKPDSQSCAGCLTSVIDCIKVVGGVKDVAIATEKPSGHKAV